MTFKFLTLSLLPITYWKRAQRNALVALRCILILFLLFVYCPSGERLRDNLSQPARNTVGAACIGDDYGIDPILKWHSTNNCSTMKENNDYHSRDIVPATYTLLTQCSVEPTFCHPQFSWPAPAFSALLSLAHFVPPSLVCSYYPKQQQRPFV